MTEAILIDCHFCDMVTEVQHGICIGCGSFADVADKAKRQDAKDQRKGRRQICPCCRRTSTKPLSFRLWKCLQCSRTFTEDEN